MKQITIRGGTDDLAEALEAHRRKTGMSLNKVILDLLRQSLSVGTPTKGNGLDKLAGTWSKEELVEFEKATEIFEQID